MTDYVRMLLEVMDRYRFCEHYPELAPYQSLAEMGKLSPDGARIILYQLQHIIDEATDFPNYLHRPPSEEQFYAKGQPTIRVGQLVEGDELPVGIRLRGRVPHVLAAGMTGGGKTSLFRVMIDQVEAINAQATSPPDQPDRV